MPKWTKKQQKLPAHHGWRSKPGHKIFVANRGAVRFDIPEAWTIEPGENGSVKFHDRPPPDDDCRLELSVFMFPNGVDWTELPMDQLVATTAKGTRERLSQTETRRERRDDLEIAWYETTFIDSGEQREARSRICVARCPTVVILLTLDFWPEDAPRLDPIWAEVLRSLELGHYIADPLRHNLH